jgi:RimJ/RimL family protein N-acetyltransferase
MQDGTRPSQGRWCHLVPAAGEHAAWFARWRSDIDTLHLWVGARRVLPPAELQADLERMLAGNMTMVVISRRLGEPAGFLQAHSFAGDWGWASLLVYFDPQRRSPGVIVESLYLFVEYLFGAFPLRKLYADVFEYNEPALRQLHRCEFKEEGRFEEHIWYRDRYWALIRLAPFRRDFEAHRHRIERLIRVQQDIEDAHEGIKAGQPPVM